MGSVLQVVAAVIIDGDRLLACRRSPGKAAAGRWEFPGGKVEEGERPDEALRREILEELATEIEVLDELTTDDTRVGDLTIRLSCFRSKLVGQAPVSSTDHDRLEWVSFEMLEEFDWAEPDLPAVTMLAAISK